MEVGLGIHGEAGLEKAEVKPCKETTKLVVDKILDCLDKLDKKSGKKFVVLINNLGSVPPMEMNIIVKHVLELMPKGTIKYLVGPAPLMTSLDMNGFSITLMPLNDKQMIKHFFESSADHCAWPHVVEKPYDMLIPKKLLKDPLNVK